MDVVSHLSKFLLISSNGNEAEEIEKIFSKFLNFVQIYVENRNVNARSFHRTQNSTTIFSFERSKHKNLSKVLFPDKAKNLNEFPLYVAFYDEADDSFLETIEPISVWTKYFHAVSENLNATLKYVRVPVIFSTQDEFYETVRKGVTDLENKGKLDFLYYYFGGKTELESYRYEEACYLVHLPPEYSITELILFLPLDNACWMWLGITVAFSTIIWRISEGHWNFFFGAFAYFVGQSAEIRT